MHTVDWIYEISSPVWPRFWSEKASLWWPSGVFHLRITLPVLDRLDAIKPVILITIRPCSITAAPSITV